MTGGAGVLAQAGEGADLVERWQDMGPTLWIVAGGLALVWLMAVGLVAAWLDPRRVRPGAATLEVQGTETPAVVNLLTTDWDLGHEAIPATLTQSKLMHQRILVRQIGRQRVLRTIVVLDWERFGRRN